MLSRFCVILLTNQLTNKHSQKPKLLGGGKNKLKNVYIYLLNRCSYKAVVYIYIHIQNMYIQHELLNMYVYHWKDCKGICCSTLTRHNSLSGASVCRTLAVAHVHTPIGSGSYIILHTQCKSVFIQVSPSPHFISTYITAALTHKSH